MSPWNGWTLPWLEIRPDLAVLSAQRLPDAAELIQMARQLEQLGVMVGYGGLIFNREPGLRARVPGHFLGEQIPLAAEKVEKLIAERPAAPQPPPIEPEYARAVEFYRPRVHSIEADVRGALGPSASPRLLYEANSTMSAHLIAASQIGYFSALHDGRPWLEASFQAHTDPSLSMRSYLATYRLAAEVHLGEDGGPIIEWLRTTRSRW